jgi:predicted HTH domain antitoxin
MQLTIDLPNDFMSLQPAPQVAKDVQLSYALWLFQQAKVTLSKAAHIAGVDLYAFMTACRESKIAVIDFTKEELKEELFQFKHA